MTPEIITQAINAKKEIKRISVETEQACEKLSAEVRVIEADYRKRIVALENERYGLTGALDQQRFDIRHKNNGLIEELRKPVERIEEIFKIMELIKEGEQDLTMTASSWKQAVLIDTPISDRFLNLQVYIYRTGTSKSKYALCLAGKSLFAGRDLIAYPYSYSSCGLDFVNGNPPLKVHLKGSATKEWLVKWWEKNKKKMGDFWNVAEHKALVEQMKYVETHCNTLEWTLAHLVSQRDAYEAQKYKHYEDKDEYKNIIKEIVNTKWRIYTRDKKLSKEPDVQGSDTTMMPHALVSGK